LHGVDQYFPRHRFSSADRRQKRKRKKRHTKEQMDPSKVNQFANDLLQGKISGNDLKDKVENNLLSKQERRKITKLAKKLATKKDEQLTERQRLRREAKEKKKLPKLDKDSRRKKYLGHLDEQRDLELKCLGQ
jgi:hypothetical protein